jgi:nitrite reductase/ring-hydroxylating ferredoxin subunit
MSKLAIDPAGQFACNRSDIPPGGRLILQLGRLSIGLFDVDGDIVAVRNICPHAGAPVCEGKVTGAIISDAPFERRVALQGRILKCPWHGWEFNLTDGLTITEPHERLLLYPVTVKDEKVFVQTSHRAPVAVAGGDVSTGANVDRR